MLQMLSGPTLYRLGVKVPGFPVHGAPEDSELDVDMHVRLAGGQDYTPYVTSSFIEEFGTFLESLGVEVYQEFTESLVKVGVSYVSTSPMLLS